MLIIGGCEENRDQIADQICTLSPHITCFDMRYPKKSSKAAQFGDKSRPGLR